MNFILGGVYVHLVSLATYTESYSRVDNGQAKHRVNAGGLKRTIHWSKKAISISGGGHIPSGLSDLDYTTDLEYSSGRTRSISSVSNIIVIPSARRIDVGFEPCAFAILANRAVATPISLLGDVATITPVADALTYQIKYYPKILVAAEQPTDSYNRATGDYSWSIDMEQV